MVQKGTGEFQKALKLLPSEMRAAASRLPESVSSRVEEFRLRVDRPICAVIGERETPLEDKVYITQAELQMVLEIATRASVHSYADSIRQGYVTAEGGLRLGLCGMAVTEGGSITALRRLSSICIRIPHEKQGCADGVFSRLTEGGFASTLIVSPPGGGKTTLLRELVRLLSDGGSRVSLVDERCEVAGCFEGRPCFDVGAGTDVLTAAPKSEGVFLLLRAMNPRIIAFDEITSPLDIEAADAAANCGVSLLTTAHAAGLDELFERPLYQRLLERRIFKHAVLIRNDDGRRSYFVEDLQ
ncbi:MAG: stage III sporulation protein AB [Oscillospiraceae bacterium]|nr:stage III sporulation protein AB [Oscillospiraceae bacterium]